MSRPNVKRFKNQKLGPNDKSQLFDYLENEVGQIVSELGGAFERGISFQDNFAGKIVNVDLTAGTELVFSNPLGKIPSGWLVISGSVPMIVEGSVWNKDQLSFNSMCFRTAEIGTDISVSTGSDYLQFTPDRFPVFTKGMKIKVTGGDVPGGLSSGSSYWINDESLLALFLSSERNGKTINLTTSGSGIVTVAATGSVKILLMK